MTEVERIQTGTRALDRVLNGGIPFSSAALISGPPGVGKSTLGFAQ
jgi:KaiC/GvpD/RAD55 family RecA-like ATPase